MKTEALSNALHEGLMKEFAVDVEGQAEVQCAHLLFLGFRNTDNTGSGRTHALPRPFASKAPRRVPAAWALASVHAVSLRPQLL